VSGALGTAQLPAIVAYALAPLAWLIRRRIKRRREQGKAPE